MLLLVGNIYVFVEGFSKPRVQFSVRYLKAEKRQITIAKNFCEELLYGSGGTSCKYGAFPWAGNPNHNQRTAIF